MATQMKPQTQADGLVDDDEIVPESCDADDEENPRAHAFEPYGIAPDDCRVCGQRREKHGSAAAQPQDTPASHLRNALQILVLAGPNWVRPTDAFAVRERIEAALAQLEGPR